MHESSLGKGRFESFSDGVFAIAVTLLILEIRLPAAVSATSSNAEQLRALLGIWPQYLVYAASFATIGILWLNHHALFTNAWRITQRCVVANLALLALIAFLPFTTEVLGRFGITPIAVVFYGLTRVAIAIAYTVLQRTVFAAHVGARPPWTRWNIVALTAYPAATLVGYVVPILGIALIALLALFYLMASNLRAVALPLPESASTPPSIGFRNPG